MMMIHLLLLVMNRTEDKGVVRLVVRVGEDVVLPCSLGPEVDIERAFFDWTKDRQEVFVYDDGFYHSEDQQFKGRVSHFQDQLKNGNASIIIRNLQVSDSGNYSCFVKRLQEHRFYVELVVGIFAEPRVMKSEITEDQTLLQCEVRGASPQISRIDSDGTVLPAEEKLKDSDGLHYLSTLMLQSTKPGIVHCQVTQQELNHITEVQISVPHTCDETVTGSNEVLLGVAIVCSTVVLLGLVVAGICCWYRRRGMRAEVLKDIISPKAKRHAVAKPEETRKLNQKAEPDKAVKISMDEL